MTEVQLILHIKHGNHFRKAEEADEISRTCAGELAGGEEHTGVPGGGQQNIAEEDRREAENPEAGQRVGGNSVEKE